MTVAGFARIQNTLNSGESSYTLNSGESSYTLNSGESSYRLNSGESSYGSWGASLLCFHLFL